ncbi:caspase domain-containing protein [Plectosphaerella cucumerina]|uniref:Caspase domain-containing protein n=1 Tax=Plectosphaerella cucumerina TaxID=40658 RepID=A0A8K0T6I3_9PEZI|nr:caspase domain-containing protein [Plectosphaerella cucumerina]
MSKSSQPTYRALLIGVSFHADPKFRLRGAAADVEAVAEFLETFHPEEPGRVKTSSFTATTATDLEAQSPIESNSSLPTDGNVNHALEQLTVQCTHGDFAYIHFSGHGTRDNGQFGLVLYSPDEPGHTVLPEPCLAEYMRVLVEKGVKVTMVLDCCFSGSVDRDSDRGGSAIRSMPTNKSSWRWTTPNNPANTNIESLLAQSHRERGGLSLYEDWIIKPDGYTILAACGPHEISRELEFVDTMEPGETGKPRERRGALSYFLLESLGDLTKKGLKVTHQALFQHVSILFHVHRPSQTPMRYGNENLCFFGDLCIPDPEPGHLVYVRNRRLFLRAGMAHGVHKGDTFALQPSNQSLAAAGSSPYNCRAIVSEVSSLTSVLEGDQGSTLEQVNTGWKATPISTLCRWELLVRMSMPRPRGGETSPNGQYLRLCYDEDCRDNHTFNVVINKAQEYEVLDENSSSIKSIPKVAALRLDAEGQIARILKHLSTFKYLQSIENSTPDPQFEQSFSVNTFANGENGGDLRPLYLTHGTQWTLHLQNNSEETRYFSIFQFTPSWDVSNLLSTQGGVIVLGPSATDSLQIMAQIPDESNEEDEKIRTDLLKVFVTSTYSYFPAMILPELIHSTKKPSPTRGPDLHVQDQNLHLFLVALSGMRSVSGNSRESWATRSILVETSLS